MPGLGEGRFNISDEALFAVLIGNTRAEDTETFKEIVKFRQWLRALPEGSRLMDIRSEAEGRTGFVVVFSALELPQTYEIPRRLYDPEHQHQPEQQLEQ